MKEYKRVRYQKSPLIEVVFQLRFPTILSINAKQPMEFQDKIREKYPFYQEGDEQQNEMIIGPDGNPVQIKTSSAKNYAFISSEESYKINLTASFISIYTLKYTQWEEFRKHIEFVVPIFETVYKPAFYTRVGLRYIDVINRENLGLEKVGWNTYAYLVRMAIRQRATVLQTSAPCWKPMPQTTRNCVLWMSLWTMVTPARTLNGLRSKTCSGNWNKGLSTAFW